MSTFLRQLIIASGVILVFFSACQKIEDAFKSENARQKYAQAIEDSPLVNTQIARQWLATGDSVLNNPVETEIPFQTKFIYYADEANAWAWQFSLDGGRTLRVHLAAADTSNQIFIDLFSMENGEPELLQSAQDSMITYTMEESQPVILRVQAELLVNGSGVLTLTDNPSMAFPVQGGIRPDIGSFWGDPRDGGRRRHEGVDIFAERGTPVLATADGRIRRTGDGGIGGKTVWLSAKGKSMYYAHLDSINTQSGREVQVGDTLGFVGNTGNARTTPPHLHFGIYNRGAINPLPFIDFANDRVEPIAADASAFQKWARISAAKANVRPLPSTDRAALLSLAQNNPVQITGGTGEWYQVKLPNNIEGFIHQSLLEPADTPLRSQNVDPGAAVYKNFSAALPLFQADSTLTINHYGTYANRHLAKVANQWVWI